MLTVYDKYGAEHALEEHEVLGIAPTWNDRMTEVYTLDRIYYARESFMQFAIRLPMRAFRFDEEMRLVRRVPLALQKPVRVPWWKRFRGSLRTRAMRRVLNEVIEKK